jgi:hypothetical protein
LHLSKAVQALPMAAVKVCKRHVHHLLTCQTALFGLEVPLYFQEAGFPTQWKQLWPTRASLCDPFPPNVFLLSKQPRIRSLRPRSTSLFLRSASLHQVLRSLIASHSLQPLPGYNTIAHGFTPVMS